MQRARTKRKLVRAATPDYKREKAALERIAGVRHDPGSPGGSPQPAWSPPQGGSHSLVEHAPDGSRSRGSDGNGHRRTVVEQLRDALDSMIRLEQQQQPVAYAIGGSTNGDAVPTFWLKGIPRPLDHSRCCHEITLGQDKLHFPFEPLPPQVSVAERALRACEQGGIAMLQSPTGTGKSIALLTATLAWQRRRFAETGAAPQILYGVRTHVQLAQMIGELRKTPYRPRMAVIGSREQLCSNEEVKTSAKLQHMPLNLACRQAARRAVALESARPGYVPGGCSCSSYTSLGSFRHARRVFDKCGRAGQLWDVEDLAKADESRAGCPYYTSHVLAGVADIVFCPHNYILDPSVSKCRSHHRERWSLEGRVVIIDEAHNLEQCCREAGSLQVSLKDLEQFTKSLRLLPSRHPRLRFHVGGSRDGEGSRRSLSCAEACAQLERIPLQIASFLEEHASSRSGRRVASQLHEQLQSVWGLPGNPSSSDFFKQAGLSEHSVLSSSMEELVLEATDRLLQVQLSSEAAAGTSPALAAADAEDAALLAVLERLRDLIFKLRLALRNSHSYVLGVSSSGSTAESDSQPPAVAASSSPVLFVWLMSPGVLFEVFASQAHSVILASGTLSPLGALGAELSDSAALATRALVEGPLEALHVVQQAQLLALVIPSFLRTGEPVVGTFASWKSSQFLAELGDTLATITKRIPAGVLCFFPSYQALELSVAAWKQEPRDGQTVWSRFQACKGAVVVEPRSSGKDLTQACQSFTGAVRRGQGALCLAVYRGKMSEGLDFADDLCRGVVCLGVPYPQTKDPVVLAKRQWNDSKRSAAQSAGLLSGEHWYELQAYRAINQALGRCLRHRCDFGALVLLDARWATTGSRARGLRRHLSKWLQPHIQEWSSLGSDGLCNRLVKHFNEQSKTDQRRLQHEQAFSQHLPHTLKQSFPETSHTLTADAVSAWTNRWTLDDSSPQQMRNEQQNTGVVLQREAQPLKKTEQLDMGMFELGTLSPALPTPMKANYSVWSSVPAQGPE